MQEQTHPNLYPLAGDDRPLISSKTKGPGEKRETRNHPEILSQKVADFECRLPYDSYSEKVFVSQERGSGFPEKGADLRGSPGTSGEVRATSGEVWETSGEPLDCC